MIKALLIPGITDRSVAISELIKRWIKKDRRTADEVLPVPMVTETKLKYITVKALATIIPQRASCAISHKLPDAK